MFNRIKRRMNDDEGNAVIILGIMLIMVLLLVGGLLLDLSKAYQVKSSYNDAARKATQAAIMEQSTQGYLKPEAAGEAVRVYETITRPSSINTGDKGVFSRCPNYDEDDVRIYVSMMKEDMSNKIDIGYVMRNEVSDGDTANEILGKFKEGVHNIEKKVNDLKPETIQLNVVEGTENVILPSAFAISQSDKNEEEMSDMKCQKMEISQRANIFIGEDGKSR